MVIHNTVSIFFVKMPLEFFTAEEPLASIRLQNVRGRIFGLSEQPLKFFLENETM